MNRESETIGTARLMAAPAVVLLFLVTIAPLIFSLTVSFTNLQFGTPQPLRFVGVDNYLSLVTKDFRFLGAPRVEPRVAARGIWQLRNSGHGRLASVGEAQY